MRVPIGTVTVRFFATGGRPRALQEIVTHTTTALEAAKFKEGEYPLRYDEFEIIAATLEE